VLSTKCKERSTKARLGLTRTLARQVMQACAVQVVRVPTLCKRTHEQAQYLDGQRVWRSCTWIGSMVGHKKRKRNQALVPHLLRQGLRTRGQGSHGSAKLRQLLHASAGSQHRASHQTSLGAAGTKPGPGCNACTALCTTVASERRPRLCAL